MEKELQAIIKAFQNAASIAVIAHVNEDPDALGSCYAAAAALRSMGKEAVCYVSGAPEKRLSFLGEDYRVYFPENISAHDLCLCLDCGDLQRLGDRKVLFDQADITVNIDHHYTNQGFAQLNWVDGGAAATAEMLAVLFQKMEISWTPEIAKFLFAAILSDTGCFKYSNVRPQTLRIAADLLEYEFDHAEVARLLFDTYTLPLLGLKGELMENVHSYADGRIQMVAVNPELFKRHGVAEGEASNLVDIPRCIEGTEIAVCLKQKENGEIRVSLRSNGNANVAEIAAQFGGGGHARAAGGTILSDSLEEAEKQLLQACFTAVEGSGQR